MTGTQFDANAASFVRTLYRTPDVVAQREAVREALGASASQRVLDVGSGPGYLAAELIADGAEVVGIDTSESMHAIAREEAPDARLCVADAACLAFADAAFDVYVSTQVLEYVPDVDAALREAARVLRPGGRIVVLDTDWDSCVWHTADRARLRTILEVWNAHCVHPHLPATLGARMRTAGFQDVSVRTVTMINQRYEPSAFSHGISRSIASFAARNGVPRESTGAWLEELAALDASAEYFFSLDRFLFTARKPDA